MRVPRRIVRASLPESTNRSGWSIVRLVVSILAALFLSGATVYDPTYSPDRPVSEP
jgi:hypothetical protein